MDNTNECTCVKVQNQCLRMHIAWSHFLFCKHKKKPLHYAVHVGTSTVTCSHFTGNKLHLTFLSALIKSVDDEVFIIAHDGTTALMTRKFYFLSKECSDKLVFFILQ